MFFKIIILSLYYKVICIGLKTSTCMNLIHVLLLVVQLPVALHGKVSDMDHPDFL